MEKSHARDNCSPITLAEARFEMALKEIAPLAEWKEAQ